MLIIIIGGEGNDIVAEHNGMEIGRFQIDENLECDFLAHMNIAQNFQRARIG